jgi:hypothetical protein
MQRCNSIHQTVYEHCFFRYVQLQCNSSIATPLALLQSHQPAATVRLFVCFYYYCCCGIVKLRSQNTIIGLVLYMVLDNLVAPIRAKKVLKALLATSLSAMKNEVSLTVVLHLTIYMTATRD